jgi:hypothetical protein
VSFFDKRSSVDGRLHRQIDEQTRNHKSKLSQRKLHPRIMAVPLNTYEMKLIMEAYISIGLVRTAKVPSDFLKPTVLKTEKNIKRTFKLQYHEHFDYEKNEPKAHNGLCGLIKRDEVIPASIAAVENILRLNENGFNIDSAGGTYQSCTNQSLMKLMAAIQRNLGNTLTTDSVFMDIGAGQNRPAWVAAICLGCQAVGIEVCRARTSLASHAARSIAVLPGVFPWTRNVALAHEGGGQSGQSRNWRGVSIFYLWDIAFDQRDLPKIYANIADAIPPGKELLLVTSVRYPVRRSMLEEHVRITKVGEQVRLRFYKNSKSTSALQIYTIARKHKSNKPGGAKLVDALSPFFGSPGTRNHAYALLAEALKTPPSKRTRATAASRRNMIPRACSATTTVTAANPSPFPDPLQHDDCMQHAYMGALPPVNFFLPPSPISMNTLLAAETSCEK